MSYNHDRYIHDEWFDKTRQRGYLITLLARGAVKDSYTKTPSTSTLGGTLFIHVSARPLLVLLDKLRILR